MRISDWSSDVCSSDLDEAEVAMTLRAVLRDVLGISEERTAAMTESTLLFGNLPEMDSMAVATLLTELEDRLGIVIDDDDIDAERSEERCVGKGVVSTVRSQCPPAHSIKKKQYKRQKKK